jgi:putative transposase
MTATRQQRSYDHRLRSYVRESGDTQTAQRLGVPRSTVHGWQTRHCKPVVSHVCGNEHERLETEIARLKQQNAVLRAWMRIALTVFKLSGFSFERQRLPDGKEKTRLLRAIHRSAKSITLADILHVIGMSPSRYHVWCNTKSCQLTDRSSCPKTHPWQATSREVATIRDMATSKDYRHVPTSTLAKLAQRLGKAHVSASTWYRLMRLHNWRRPRRRVHPPKPKVGIRAGGPNQLWHIDATLIRLLDGSKVYLHAVIDNYSRRIMAWKMTAKFEPTVTAELLTEAARNMDPSDSPEILVDGGVENYNAAVDAVIAELRLKRVLAQTEITFSNSMIEAWWRVLKHQWLYLNQLESLAGVKNLVAYYVEQHNEHLPHSAFKGQTPNEMHFGTGAKVPDRLKAEALKARVARRETNLALSCSVCDQSSQLVNASQPAPNTS